MNAALFLLLMRMGEGEAAEVTAIPAFFQRIEGSDTRSRSLTGASNAYRAIAGANSGLTPLVGTDGSYRKVSGANTANREIEG